VRIEIGAGENPHPDYDVRVDILQLPGITHVAAMDNLPFPDAAFSALRACDVLEHQSWQLVPATLQEWARVLVSGAEVYIQVPNARSLAERWVSGNLTTAEANYWILGGHGERDAHKGIDEHAVPRWLYNAHHTMFDDSFLGAQLDQTGYCDIRIHSDGGSNLMCWCTRR
jgi:predicted SAM-dependent methyltransferase